MCYVRVYVFFFSSRRRHTRLQGDWSSDVCSSDLAHSFAVALSANHAGNLQRTQHGHLSAVANRFIRSLPEEGQPWGRSEDVNRDFLRENSPPSHNGGAAAQSSSSSSSSSTAPFSIMKTRTTTTT